MVDRAWAENERLRAELQPSRHAQALGVGGGFSGSRVVEGIDSEAPAAPMAAASASLPRAPSVPQPASSSPYPPPPPVEAQGVRGLMSGLLGRSRSQSPPPGSRPQTEPTSANQQTSTTSAQSPSPNLMDLLAANMLQSLQNQSQSSGEKSPIPEQDKPGTVAFPAPPRCCHGAGHFGVPRLVDTRVGDCCGCFGHSCWVLGGCHANCRSSV